MRVTAVDKFQALWGGNREIDPQGQLSGRSVPALALGMLLWSQESAFGAVDCGLKIGVPSRENRAVYTEQNYPDDDVIIKRPEAVG